MLTKSLTSCCVDGNLAALEVGRVNSGHAAAPAHALVPLPVPGDNRRLPAQDKLGHFPQDFRLLLSQHHPGALAKL